MTPPSREDLTRDPRDLGKDRCAVVLRKALASSDRFDSIRALAEAAGLNYSSVANYFSGRRLPSPDAWGRLSAALGRGTASGQAAAQGQTAAPGRLATPPSRADDPLQHAEAVRRRILELTHELGYFKRGGRASREVLRQAISGRDIGYLTSLLRALYDEDQFETWILFSDYEIEGGAPRSDRSAPSTEPKSRGR